MSKMSELSQVLDELAACGQRLTEAAQAIRSMFKEEEPEKSVEKPAEEAVTPKKYSFTDVRGAFASKSHAGHTEEVKALIAAYGANKLSDIKEEDYAGIMADLEAIV